MMSISKHLLVTGGAGFIGSNFARLALQNGMAVTVLDKLTYAGQLETLADISGHDKFFFLNAGIEDTDTIITYLQSLNEDQKITAALNFAAETHVDRSIDYPEVFFETNVLGTQKLISSLRQNIGLKPDFRFLHISTDEVFGSVVDKAFDEESQYRPNSPYSASKAGADHLVRAAVNTYDFPALITNCSNNFGPYQFPEKFIPTLIIKALQGQSMPIYGDGRQERDWLFVDDHCRALQIVLEHGKIGETYMVGTNEPQQNLTLARLICDILDELRPLSRSTYHSFIEFVEDRPGHDKKYSVNAQKIEALGWTPAADLKNNLRNTIQWYIDHAGWWESIITKGFELERMGKRT